jgi:hypothetical protein
VLEAEAILERIDRAIAELQAIKAEIAASIPTTEGNGLDVSNDFADVIEISTAVERFNRPADTLRYWCRREGCGVKVGGRWMASPARIKRKLGVE